jgi:hypothetical protein
MRLYVSSVVIKIHEAYAGRLVKTLNQRKKAPCEGAKKDITGY